MPTGDYYLQFLDEIDASGVKVSRWEAQFLEDLLKQRPQYMSPRRQAVIRRMARLYLNAEVECDA